MDPPEYQDDYRDWKQAKDDETEAFKRAAAAAGRADDFVVGARPLDERMLSRLMLQLLQNHTREHRPRLSSRRSSPTCASTGTSPSS